MIKNLQFNCCWNRRLYSVGEKVKKVVLAYSGGLDTSVILKWLIETYDCEVITFSADIGQEEELDQVREKAFKTGASKVYIDDLKEIFVKDFVFPVFRANSILPLDLHSRPFECKYFQGKHH